MGARRDKDIPERREARSHRAPRSTSVTCFLAAGRRLAETRERVQVAHQRVATDVRRRALRRLRDVVRSSAHEPREEHLVLRVVGPSALWLPFGFGPCRKVLVPFAKPIATTWSPVSRTPVHPYCGTVGVSH